MFALYGVWKINRAGDFYKKEQEHRHDALVFLLIILPLLLSIAKLQISADYVFIKYCSNIDVVSV